jgi:3,4-dihydroxy 2-butanone 4-phosphate synthase / GTP cyclohydrolase II
MTCIEAPEAITRFRRGEFLIVVDDEDRENEGDLTIGAQFVTPDVINFMARYGRGLICMPMTGERLDQLDLPMMVHHNTSHHGTPFTISVEARDGVTTGISTADRARTVQVLIDPRSTPEDLVSPGHMFPLRANDGGVLRRAGQTEAGVDLAKLAGLYPAAVICEIMNEDGTMARHPQLEVFSAEHGIPIVSVASLIEYRQRTERLVQRVTEPVQLPTRHGDFLAIGYKSTINQDEHVALVLGDVATDEPVLVRVHSECVTGDVFGSQRCDCGEQLDLAMQMIAGAGCGAIVYLRGQEGRGIGLHNKLKAYKLQEQGADTVDANTMLGLPKDARHYGIGAQILADLGLKRLRIMTNNPAKRAGIEGYGLEIVDQVPIAVPPNPHNVAYLRTKRERMGHQLDDVDVAEPVAPLIAEE